MKGMKSLSLVGLMVIFWLQTTSPERKECTVLYCVTFTTITCFVAFFLCYMFYTYGTVYILHVYTS